MNCKKLLSGIFALSLVFSLASCGDNNSENTESSSDTQQTEIPEETNAPEPVEEETQPEEELVPPVPSEADDENAVTFDNDDFSFASIITDDDNAAGGELSVAEVQGNKMLKFTDDMSVDLDGKVQKISINAAKLLGADRLADVRSIEFDVYADAVSPNYINEEGDSIQAPGTISCGGGTVTAQTDDEGNGKWYDFAGFEGGEYNFDMSGAVHGTFKFLLADSGLCWSEDMEDANFLVMRWGIENESNMYIDNIVFLDSDGNSIPVLSE